jgi:predicted transcriptional regulator
MTTVFLKVNKDLFKLKLNPTEILLLAQIIEYQTNTGDFFMSDDVLAENFGVSSKTISRALTSLEGRGFITRITKNVKGGRERHITANINKIDECLTKDNLTVVNEVPGSTQGTKCPLTTDNLSLDKGQNDFIKDNIKDKEKDNLYECCDKSQPSINQEQEEIKVVGKIKKSKLDSMGCIYEDIGNNLIKIKATNKVFEIEGE